ncbi:MAG TPA: ATPase with chaperone activity [Burkholderiaceae bacterium]|nr:ATPase with chaperone activity [Burkholderiaceae bacterium]
MSEDSQILIPPSFIALFTPPGRHKPTASRDEIARRYEYCEDLATLLTEQARTVHWQLGITEADVLERVRRGLLTEDAGATPAEAGWILRRLAELLEWPAPQEP